MTSFRILWLVICLTWLSGEFLIAQRSRQQKYILIADEQITERLIWFCFILGFIVAFIFKSLVLVPFPFDYVPRQIAALTIFCLGVFLRYSAVKKLKNLFSTQIQIHTTHTIVSSGLYRHIRHPSYAGILLAFLGIGLAMGDILALMALLIFGFFGIHKRIAVEEHLMVVKLGSDYSNYCKHTDKLIPWVY